jgi:hypothetical protein
MVAAVCHPSMRGKRISVTALFAEATVQHLADVLQAMDEPASQTVLT